MNTPTFRKSPLFRFIAFTVLVAFALLQPVQPSFAQVAIIMPPPGQMVHITSHFEPPQMIGLKINLKDPFRFDFIMDQGEKPMSDLDKKEEFNKLIKYFLVSLAMPNKDMWVNLSPYESGRIIPEVFGQTEMGRDLLAQDYILKQFTASLMYPEDGLGKKFWNKVYAQAESRFGTTNISVNTFNKVWIVADKADVYQKDDTAFLVKSHLKVMLEQDYMAIEKNKEQFGNAAALADTTKDARTQMASQVVREIIIPAIEKEVNEGKSFAAVRQVYNAEIMATWFKKTLRQSLLGQVFANTSKIAGQKHNDPVVMEKIYRQYLKAYKKGVFNFIKEDAAPDGQMIPRKYFSGGAMGVSPAMVTTINDQAMSASPVLKGEVKSFGRTIKKYSLFKGTRIFLAAAVITTLAGAILSTPAEARGQNGHQAVIMQNQEGELPEATYVIPPPLNLLTKATDVATIKRGTNASLRTTVTPTRVDSKVINDEVVAAIKPLNNKIQEYSQRISNLINDFNGAVRTLQATQEQLNGANAEKAGLNKEIDSLKAANGDAVTAVIESDKKRHELEQDLRNNKDKLTTLTSQFTALNDEISNYNKYGLLGILAAFGIGAALAYLLKRRTIAKANAELANTKDELAAAITENAELKTSSALVQENLNEQNAEVARLKAESDKLEAQLAANNEEIARLKAEIEAASKRAKEAEENLKAAEAELPAEEIAVDKAVNDIKPSAELSPEGFKDQLQGLVKGLYNNSARIEDLQKSLQEARDRARGKKIQERIDQLFEKDLVEAIDSREKADVAFKTAIKDYDSARRESVNSGFIRREQVQRLERAKNEARLKLLAAQQKVDSIDLEIASLMQELKNPKKRVLTAEEEALENNDEFIRGIKNEIAETQGLVRDISQKIVELGIPAVLESKKKELVPHNPSVEAVRQALRTELAQEANVNQKEKDFVVGKAIVAVRKGIPYADVTDDDARPEAEQVYAASQNKSEFDNEAYFENAIQKLVNLHTDESLANEIAMINDFQNGKGLNAEAVDNLVDMVIEQYSLDRNGHDVGVGAIERELGRNLNEPGHEPKNLPGAVGAAVKGEPLVEPPVQEEPPIDREPTPELTPEPQPAALVESNLAGYVDAQMSVISAEQARLKAIDEAFQQDLSRTYDTDKKFLGGLRGFLIKFLSAIPVVGPFIMRLIVGDELEKALENSNQERDVYLFKAKKALVENIEYDKVRLSPADTVSSLEEQRHQEVGQKITSSSITSLWHQDQWKAAFNEISGAVNQRAENIKKLHDAVKSIIEAKETAGNVINNELANQFETAKKAVLADEKTGVELKAALQSLPTVVPAATPAADAAIVKVLDGINTAISQRQAEGKPLIDIQNDFKGRLIAAKESKPEDFDALDEILAQSKVAMARALNQGFIIESEILDQIRTGRANLEGDDVEAYHLNQLEQNFNSFTQQLSDELGKLSSLKSIIMDIRDLDNEVYANPEGHAYASAIAKGLRTANAKLLPMRTDDFLGPFLINLPDITIRRANVAPSAPQNLDNNEGQPPVATPENKQIIESKKLDEIEQERARLFKIGQDLRIELNSAKPRKGAISRIGNYLKGRTDGDVLLAKAEEALLSRIAINDAQPENKDIIEITRKRNSDYPGEKDSPDLYLKMWEEWQTVQMAYLQEYHDNLIKLANTSSDEEKEMIKEKIKKLAEDSISVHHIEGDKATLANKNTPLGGISLSDEHLTINIKVDGAGMPLPAQYQDKAMLNLNGLTSIIRKITPITPQNVPALYELVK